MADQEKLSALMDGEVVDKALISEIQLDQECLDTWKNYHLIGDVMRGDTPKVAEWNIAGSVALALEDEPTHSLLNSNVSELATHRETQPTPSQARRYLPDWMPQFGQVAVAACVSLAVIFGVQQYSGAESSSAEQFPVLQTIPLSGSVEPVSLSRESVGKQNQNVNVQEQRRRVNAMLLDYELQLRLNSEYSDGDIIEPVIE
ncbi:RseA family anti-sigma factor [Vibrio genomosp. F10]|uniref:Anti-sigma-E factor RseA n=2 Tax=Vibrio genomosp. F10 TaxID=723171 RepID=A0A1B9R2H5_9VIBR|nr:RseA family anti-sigma factor [Vibrio genomosp. F10]OCH78234.1 anti-sigma E factor [Vibrio genomosp. F10]OEE34306.1 anti-sigma E factor [Vibrio genomosp. F10 str. ZF-129]OEE95074.1 anti-sigma E factor [Vibrio genomosp. F10 str. 9ZD137]OEE95757.1 anti-sigma E factor [Vibrio genomosp. F10 str. 9ZC157]OEF03798.1 anti-sigma E factor [Vibrio genomosp. F10 str. 9ZB36]